MIQKRTKKNLALALVITILSISMLSAFGVDSPYWNERPLYLDKEQSADVTLTLQNMVGSADILLRAKITNGTEIARLTDQNLDYLVPAGTKDNKVNLKIEIPNSVNNNKYIVSVSFQQISQEEGGMIQIAGEVGKSFPVIIGIDPNLSPETTEIQKNAPITKEWLFILFISIILALIAIIVIIKKMTYNSDNTQ
ncbi:MAG: hypothetical protein AABX73_03565 [Nanoarchaeota archaeon]